MKCCCNIFDTLFVEVILVIAGNSEYVIVTVWSLFGSLKISNLYKSVQIAAEKCFIILTVMRFLSSFKHFYYLFDIAVGFLLYFLVGHCFGICTICKFLQKSCKSAHIRKDRNPGYFRVSIFCAVKFRSLQLPM